MPFVEAWYALEGLGEAAAASEAAGTAAAASEAAAAAEAASAASAASTAGAGAAGAAGAAGTAAMGAELAGLSQLGAAGAELAPALEGAAAIGGEGAGSAGIQTAMEQAMQQAPTQFTGEAAAQGITQASPQFAGEAATQGITQVPAQGVTQVNPAMSYDAFGNPAPAGSPAATMADPTGLAQAQLEVNAAQSAPSALETGWDKFSKFADKHPMLTGSALYLGAHKLGWLDPKSAQMPNTAYTGPLNKYRLSENFQAGRNEPNVNPYRPTYPSYAGGGIMEAQDYPQSQLPHPGGYSTGWQSPMAREPFAGSTDVGVDGKTGEMQQMASGGVARYAKGNLTETLDFYKRMIEPSTASGASAPHSGGDAGIYYDMDPDTRYQDALTAAQIRQAKLNKRASMQLPSGGIMQRPTPMGSINLRAPGAKADQSQYSQDSENAAQGGIMQARSTLGGYAAGGNPRLLKGPGDGMSDNIPATIAGKQPARLADGEFVVPADVVSHLGNGSTDAGAKKLHEMMTNVRKARTGNPKQGKQINPGKYMPK